MTNALALFQNMINKIFKDIIDLDIVAYIDDILIYSQIKEKYEKPIKDILSRSQQ
jgi:hypothetical protein